ncbi:MAG: efflux RND transporter periplasmic adaptor subunit [Candidatus Cryptobacteroides sp.]
MNSRILAIAGVMCVLSACSGKKPATSNNIEAKIPTVRTVAAVEETVDVDQNYSVTLQAFAVNNIAPQSGSRIMSIDVEVGDFVKKDQELARMDKSQLQQSELQLKNLKDEYQRAKSLYEKGGVSKSDFESIELQYNVANTTYENLLTNTILKSPLNGVVTARNYDCGDMYTMSAPLFVVQQIDPMKALVAVSEKEYSLLKEGLNVEFTPEALGKKIFTGKVNRIYPTVDPATHTVIAEVLIDNPSAELRPGMYSNVRLIFGSKQTILVPDTAVLKQQGSGVRTVYVLNADNSVSSRVVEIGRHLGDRYEVLSGLKKGEIVVTSGQSALKDGSKVEVLK